MTTPDVYTDVKTTVAQKARNMTHRALVQQWRGIAGQIRNGLATDVQLGASAALVEEINQRGLDVTRYR